MSLRELALTEAVKETERDIFNAGAGIEPPENTGPNESLEQISGWDGKPLGDDEQLEAAFRGRDNSGNDRPLQLAEETNEYETAVQKAKALEAENAQLRTKYEPTIRGDAEARQERARQEIIAAALENPDGVLGHMENLRAAHTELDTGRVETSLRAAHTKYGADFERVYGALDVRRNPELVKDPVARAIVQRIWQHADPGEALMEWSGRGIVQSGRGESRSAPPFMPQPERSAAPRSNRRTSDSDNYWEKGRSDVASTEAEIWRSLED
jgi:hypothetical protein